MPGAVKRIMLLNELDSLIFGRLSFFSSVKIRDKMFRVINGIVYGDDVYRVPKYSYSKMNIRTFDALEERMIMITKLTCWNVYILRKMICRWNFPLFHIYCKCKSEEIKETPFGSHFSMCRAILFESPEIHRKSFEKERFINCFSMRITVQLQVFISISIAMCKS